MSVDKGMPRGDDWVFIIPMLSAPFFSLITIFGTKTKGNSLLSLYLKRKTLEEKQKIAQFTENKD